MTREEAIKAMKNGQKVTHRYFDEKEYITMDGKGNVVMEDGNKIPEEYFWKDRMSTVMLREYWGQDWEIFTDDGTGKQSLTPEQKQFLEWTPEFYCKKYGNAETPPVNTNGWYCKIQCPFCAQVVGETRRNTLKIIEELNSMDGK